MPDVLDTSKAFGLAASKGAIQGNLSSLNTHKKSAAAVPDGYATNKSGAVADTKGEAGSQAHPTLAKVQAELQVKVSQHSLSRSFSHLSQRSANRRFTCIHGTRFVSTLRTSESISHDMTFTLPRSYCRFHILIISQNLRADIALLTHYVDLHPILALPRPKIFPAHPPTDHSFRVPCPSPAQVCILGIHDALLKLGVDEGIGVLTCAPPPGLARQPARDARAPAPAPARRPLISSIPFGTRPNHRRGPEDPLAWLASACASDRSPPPNQPRRSAAGGVRRAGPAASDLAGTARGRSAASGVRGGRAYVRMRGGGSARL